jgi:hypothetical protein
MKKLHLRGVLPLFLLGLLLGLAGCLKHTDPPDPPIPPTSTYPTKPPATLPAATQTGAGTLGCKINGRVWTFWIPPIALTPEQDAFVFESNSSGIAYIKSRIWSADTFAGTYRVYHNLSFTFYNPVFEPKEIQNTGAGMMGEDEFRFSLLTYDNKDYYPDTSYHIKSNKLIIDKIDAELNIVSGRFDLTLYRGHNYGITDRLDSLIITDGRFDFKYSPQ